MIFSLYKIFSVFFSFVRKVNVTIHETDKSKQINCGSIGFRTCNLKTKVVGYKYNRVMISVGPFIEKLKTLKLP